MPGMRQRSNMDQMQHRATAASGSRLQAVWNLPQGEISVRDRERKPIPDGCIVPFESRPVYTSGQTLEIRFRSATPCHRSWSPIRPQGAGHRSPSCSGPRISDLWPAVGHPESTSHSYPGKCHDAPGSVYTTSSPRHSPRPELVPACNCPPSKVCNHAKNDQTKRHRPRTALSASTHLGRCQRTQSSV
jgi:hypothetical protein